MYRNLKIALIIIMSAFSYMANAQINLPWPDEERDQNEIRSSTIMGCIDGDSVTDSMYYDFRSHTIVVLLSTHNFEPIYLDYMPVASTEIGIGKGGFYENQNGMRRFVTYGHEYEVITDKFRLVGYYDEYLGNVTNDASGTSFLDLTADRFVGNWNYWDSELELLISMPTIEAKIKNNAIYFNNNESELYFPIDSIFNYYKREAIVKDRVARIDTEELLKICRYKKVHQEEWISSIDTLLNNFGIGMKIDSSEKFSIEKSSDQETAGDYSSRLIALHPKKNIIMYLVEFDFGSGDCVYSLLEVHKNNMIISSQVQVNRNQLKEFYLEQAKDGTLALQGVDGQDSVIFDFK